MMSSYVQSVVVISFLLGTAAGVPADVPAERVLDPNNVDHEGLATESAKEENAIENRDLPPWLIFAQLLSDRLIFSEDLLTKLDETVKNNSKILAEVRDLINEKLSKTCNAKASDEHLDRTTLPVESPENASVDESIIAPGIRVLPDTDEPSTGSFKSTNTRLTDLQKRVHDILQKLKKTHTFSSRLQDIERSLEREVNPACVDNLLIVGCLDIAATNLCGHYDTYYWTLCCKSCTYADILREIIS